MNSCSGDARRGEVRHDRPRETFHQKKQPSLRIALPAAQSSFRNTAPPVASATAAGLNAAKQAVAKASTAGSRKRATSPTIPVQNTPRA